MPRILDLLARRSLRATFFTPAWVVATWPALCRRAVDDGHELAAHGYRHERFFTLTEQQEREVLSTTERVFSDELGVTPLGFRAPSGDFSRNTLRLLHEFGYAYSSSMRSGDAPFIHTESRLVEIPAKSLFDDYAYFAYSRDPHFPPGLDRIAGYRETFASWREELRASVAAGTVPATIWHPKILGTPGRLVLLEKLLMELQDAGLEFATACDIAHEVAAKEAKCAGQTSIAAHSR